MFRRGIRVTGSLQVHFAHGLNEASDVGKGIGAALVVVFWVVTDFFLGLGYLIYKLASRR